VVGTLSTFVMTAYVLPDRPESVLRATIRALRARMAIVVDTPPTRSAPAGSMNAGAVAFGRAPFGSTRPR
jgi:hypothetical protein